MGFFTFVEEFCMSVLTSFSISRLHDITLRLNVEQTLRKEYRMREGRQLPRRSRNSSLAREGRPVVDMERKRRTSGRSTTQLADGEPSTEEGPAKREKVTPCIQYTDVTAASFRIRKGVKETPLKVKTQRCFPRILMLSFSQRNRSPYQRCWE